jgi:hypothetical protein
MQLNPGERFTLFRQIGDHTDTSRNNYYVKAVIRSAYDKKLLKEVNLTVRDNGEYYGE